MEISGPFLNPAKKAAGHPSCWYLSYSVPKINPDGTVRLNAKGRPVLDRHRPFYPTKQKAEADKPRINDQQATTGAGKFLLDRHAADEYGAAKTIVGEVSLVDVAKFWRLHHPETKRENLRELLSRYVNDARDRYGLPPLSETNDDDEEELQREPRHLSDLRSRIGAFVATKFGERQPETISRREIIGYVRTLPDVSPRTRRNHKNALSAFFGWIRDQELIGASPAAGIRRRVLGKEKSNEIGFLSLDELTRYFRAAERYAPELVAHEVVQLIAGVRADDEMRDFRGEFVLARTRQVVIPAGVDKMNNREVIDGLEDNFWAWWTAYGCKDGRLRPKNYGPRWDRLRVLASVSDQSQADRLARMPIKALLKMPVAKEALEKWPWNGRRRTFCTYHVAKHQNADKTALIMRHRGSVLTLHNSYRGLGVTQDDGVKYFQIMPAPVASPILPERVLKGAAKGSAEEKTKGAESSPT